MTATQGNPLRPQGRPGAASELIRLARRWVRTREDAEDVVQDVWLSYLRRRGGVQRPASWLKLMTARGAWRLTKRNRNRRNRERSVARAEPEASVFERLERESTLRAVTAIVETLPEPYRTVVRLRYLEELPIAEIARRERRSSVTVRSQLKRGLDRLRERLRRTG